MANRHSLHISKLEDFKNWLEKDGWTLCELSKSPYEVLRARKDGISNPLIVYKKLDAKEHLSVADRDYPVIAAFLKTEKKQTNADRIRNMTDEELVNMLFRGIKVLYDNNHNRSKVLEWLQSEADIE